MKKMKFLRPLILRVSILFLMSVRVQGQSATEWRNMLEKLNAFPDLILTNGKIATMDGRLTEAEAMAVRSSRIVTLGSNAEIRRLAGPRTEILDAKGRRVLPGLINTHAHVHLFAVAHWLGAEGDFTSRKYNDPQLKAVVAKGNDQVEVLRSLERVVRQRAQELGPGKWILVYLFAKDSVPAAQEVITPLFETSTSSSMRLIQREGRRGPINRTFLDTLSPNNPLLVMSSEAISPSAHNTLAAEQMMRFLGVEVEGLPAHSVPVYDIILRDRTEDKADFIKRELLQCVVAQGITTWSDTFKNSPSIMKAFNLLYQRGEMPARFAWWFGHYQGPGWDYARDDLRFFYVNMGDLRGIGNDYIWNAGVAHESWEEGISCTTAKPLDPSARNVRPDCSTIDPKNYDQQGGYRNVKSALETGLRVGFLHGMNDGTYDVLFHLIEEEIAAGKVTLEQVRALRIGLEHNPYIRPDQIQKLAYYGMIPGFNGWHIANSRGRAFLRTYGERDMAWLEPMKSLVDAGAHPVLNTDTHLGKVPIEFKDMDYPAQWDGNIWGFMEFFVTRRYPEDGVLYNRNEAMDRVNMMKAATIWGAEQVLNEKNIGSLEAGKLADFIVIDKDYFTIPENQIGTIKTLLTVVGGKTVYKAPNY